MFYHYFYHCLHHFFANLWIFLLLIFTPKHIFIKYIIINVHIYLCSCMLVILFSQKCNFVLNIYGIVYLYKMYFWICTKRIFEFSQNTFSNFHIFYKVPHKFSFNIVIKYITILHGTWILFFKLLWILINYRLLL